MQIKKKEQEISKQINPNFNIYRAITFPISISISISK